MVLLDGMPHGANQSDGDEGRDEERHIGTLSLPFDRAASSEEHLSPLDGQSRPASLQPAWTEGEIGRRCQVGPR